MEVRVWQDSRGREPVTEYLRRVARAGERGVVATAERYIDLLETHGPPLGMPIDRPLDSAIGLYELRAGDHRLAYGEAQGALYLLHAWRKQARRAPRRDVARARSRLLQLRQ